MKSQQKDIRDAFFDELLAVGAGDEQMIVITNDMDVFSLRHFRQGYPERFVNIGVAEQNMISVAAGLASCGKKVVVYGISSFVTFRCYEQIKFNVCSMRLPVVLVGVGSGLAFSFDGPSHHGMQDIAVMRALPEMTIYNPGDTVAAAACARLSLASPGPVFVRIDKGTFPALHDPDGSVAEGFGILRPLCESNIISTGYMTPRALAVADTLADRGISVGVIDLFRLKPLPDHFVTEILARSSRLVTVEENAVTGGLGSLVGDAIIDHGLPISLLRLGAADEQVLRYGDRDWLLSQYGLDEASLSDRIASFLAAHERSF